MAHDEGKTIASTSDQRVVNNVMRHNYKVLDQQGKDQMQAVKDKGFEFIRLLHEIGGTVQTFDTAPSDTFVHQGSRELALAQTHIEDAVMRAVRHITQ